MKRRSNEPADYQHSKKCFRMVGRPIKVGAEVQSGNDEEKKWEPTHIHSCLSALEEGVRGRSDETVLAIYGTVENHLQVECCNHHENSPKNGDAVDNNTKLRNAVRQDDQETVELLLKNCADVGSKWKYNLTPLHMAAYRGNPKIIDILLRHGASIDSKCVLARHSWLPLHLAIFGRRCKVVQQLLYHENVSKNNLKWPEPSSGEVDEDLMAIRVYLFVSKIDRETERRKTRLLDSVDSSMREYKALIHHCLEMNRDNPSLPSTKEVVTTLFHEAIHKGFEKIVVDMLNWGAEINLVNYRSRTSGHMPLHTAAETNRWKILKLLLDRGAIINDRDTMNYYTPLQKAAGSGGREAVEALFKHIDETGNQTNVGDVVKYASEALVLAAENGHAEIARVLLDRRADVNFKRYDDETALHLAVRAGHEPAVEILLRYGADHGAKNYAGMTALDVAMNKLSSTKSQTQLNISKRLLGGGADIDKISHEYLDILTLALLEKLVIHRG